MSMIAFDSLDTILMPKQLSERLAREGVKTHKERVEELNKYLSNLSEHHDMYVIPFARLINRLIC